MPARGRPALLVLLALMLAACGSTAEGYALAIPPPTPTPQMLPPVRLPQDDAPHDNLMEWWYYTGHLRSQGRTFGFELVVFQVSRSRVPTSYIAHFAVTDPQRGVFRYDQRRVSRGAPQQGLRLDVGGWKVTGADGSYNLEASMPGYALSLRLQSTKPPVLHMGTGLLDFGAAGKSYYYSYTRLDAAGTLDDRGTRLQVTGEAWMDHQWGDFLVGPGGWDWFSIQLNDGSEVMVQTLRDAGGKPVASYGTLVRPDGTSRALAQGDLQVLAAGRWRSPRTGISYPSGWRIALPGEGMDLTLAPVLQDQELDTRATTGVVYWEGAVRVTGTRGGKPVTGEGYTELTGYR